MRILPLALLMLAVSLQAAQPSPPDPLWDGHESVSVYARRAHLEETKTLDLGGGIKLELVLIPAGRFIMGTPEPNKPTISILSGQVLIGIGAVLSLAMLVFLVLRKRTGRRFSFSLRWLLAFSLACSVMVWGGTRWYQALVQNREYAAAMAQYSSVTAQDFLNADEKSHPVLISKAFYMGKFAVTQEQYEAIMGEHPSNFKGPKNPVEPVTWDDANAFCDELNAKFNAILSGSMSLKLPTEAQWEYACRAGTQTRFYSGDADSDLDTVAWYESNSGGKTHPVGGKKANTFGLYDMHGNVWQWCQDAFRDHSNNAQDTYRVLRGGSWSDRPGFSRASSRGIDSPYGRNLSIGFRVVLVPPSRSLP